jgi:hypothetical protein
MQEIDLTRRLSMQISKQATKGHLIAGIILVGIALVALIATLYFGQSIISLLVFFFGVWGGVELGRYLEYKLTIDN